MEKKWVTFLLFSLTLGSSSILFSLGASSARWSETLPIDYFINVHAGLLFVAGVGLFVVGLWCNRLHIRIEKLEDIIKESKSPDL